MLPVAAAIAGCGFQPSGLELTTLERPPSVIGPPDASVMSAPLPEVPPPSPTEVDELVDAGGADVGSDVGGEARATANAAGPVLWLKFDEPEDGEHPRDDSGHYNRVTAHNVESRQAWVEGRRGAAFDLGAEGRDGYLEVTHSTSLAAIEDGLTIAVWLRRPCHSDPGDIVSHRSNTDQPAYELSLVHSHLRARLNTGLELTSPQEVPADRWVHLAFTYDRRVARLFVDGREVAASAHSAPIRPAATPLFIGAAETSTKMRNFLPDRLDELLLYARPLSAHDIRTLTTLDIPAFR
jgi:hypothetical protein